MDCKYAYMKDKIPYVLCRKEVTPTGYDRKELFHAVCPHQEHCPKLNCHKLTPSWMNCFKLRQSAQDGTGVAFVADAQQPGGAQKTPSRSRRKPQNGK